MYEVSIALFAFISFTGAVLVYGFFKDEA